MVRYFLVLLIISFNISAQTFTKDDTLRGAMGAGRTWWDLKHYDLNVKVDLENKSISGYNVIRFKVLSIYPEMQIDLQEPLSLDSIKFNNTALAFRKEGKNAYFINLKNEKLEIGSTQKLAIYYHGKPKEAIRAPWDGGFSWTKDSNGNHFVATSCQGLGSSVWWPCKDHMYDEPDSMAISVAVPNGYTNVSNGKLRETKALPDNYTQYQWAVTNPINNYGVNINVGKYVNFTENFKGEKGILPCSYWVLEQDLEKAKIHFKDAIRTLQAFEHWFGPYPFYEDSYKLVQVPYLGMEHQSSVTYGNKFQNGYLGRDLSGTGWGLKWDFIIVHESGHEWFANNITYKDVADMWIHESFTNYSETLFTQYHYGKTAGDDYVIGTRKNIKNDIPIIGIYDVNQEGSGDMYYKGGNMIHTIRNVINDDKKFRNILRGLNSDFYHQTVTTAQIENYVSEKSGIDFSKVFDQYLRNTKIPILKIKKQKSKIYYHYDDVIPGFNMPLRVNVDGKMHIIKPTEKTKALKGKKIEVDRNFYVKVG